ncbi:MAG: PQQ-dependent sugar dehydrogenase [Vicinamibacterales bacterium]
MHRVSGACVATAVFGLLLAGPGIGLRAQSSVPRVQTSGPYTLTTIADGLDAPWGMTFLPDGTILVTEMTGRLRVIRNGVLQPAPIAGPPDVFVEPYGGLMDVALHPDFASNQFVYLTYNKKGPPLPPGVPTMGKRLTLGYSPSGDRPELDRLTSTLAVARGRWTGAGIANLKDIFVADDWKDQTVPATTASRLVFGRDGTLYVSVGGANAPASAGRYAGAQGGVAQDPARHGGKVLRLHADGTVPKDNPFVTRAGYRPEIFTLGHRNTIGMAMHPDTGAIWVNENGPQDGDEINILKAGANYGWPVVGMGRDYFGDFIGGPGSIGAAAANPDAPKMHLDGMEQPFIFWTPTVAPSGMTFYTGDRFPNWKGSLLVGELKGSRVERIVFNDKGGVTRREYLFADLKRRIRDVHQGPDGWVYLILDGKPGSVLRVERTP